MCFLVRLFGTNKRCLPRVGESWKIRPDKTIKTAYHNIIITIVAVNKGKVTYRIGRVSNTYDMPIKYFVRIYKRDCSFSPGQ